MPALWLETKTARPVLRTPSEHTVPFGQFYTWLLGFCSGYRASFIIILLDSSYDLQVSEQHNGRALLLRAMNRYSTRFAAAILFGVLSYRSSYTEPTPP